MNSPGRCGCSPAERRRNRFSGCAPLRDGGRRYRGRRLRRRCGLNAFIRHGGVGQRFGGAPVERLVARRHLGAVRVDFRHARLHFDRFRHGADAACQLLQALHLNLARVLFVPLVVQVRRPVKECRFIGRHSSTTQSPRSSASRYRLTISVASSGLATFCSVRTSA